MTVRLMMVMFAFLAARSWAWAQGLRTLGVEECEVRKIRRNSFFCYANKMRFHAPTLDQLIIGNDKSGRYQM